jgi:hypothetical protein
MLDSLFRLLRDPVWQFVGVVVTVLGLVVSFLDPVSRLVGVVAVAGLVLLGVTVAGIARAVHARRAPNPLPAHLALSSPPAAPTPDAQAMASRRAYADRFLEYVRRHPAEIDPTSSLHRAVHDRTVLEPMGPDSRFAFVDCICSAVTRADRTILMLPSGDSAHDVEGVGRTSVLLRLLGVRIPYGRLLGLLDGPSVELPDKIEIFGSDSRNPEWCKIVAADMAYIGAAGHRLCVIPTRGEPLSFIWDLARHIFRSARLTYRSGDHRAPAERSTLAEIFHRIQLAPLLPLFANLEATPFVDEIFILRREAPSPNPPTRREIGAEEKPKLLRSAFLVSAKHQSSFWRRDRHALERAIDFMVAHVDWQRVPVREIVISHANEVIPKYVFDEAATLIRTGVLDEGDPLPAEMKAGVGVRYHNQELFKSLGAVNELRILATSGEHLFRDVAFWKELAALNASFQLKVLLLDPASPMVPEREARAYKDKPPGFLAHEIQENIDTILRMTRHFGQRGRVRLQCAVYRDIPPFRMTIIGRQRALVASYEEDKPTGGATVFYNVDEGSSLLWGFRKLYDTLEAEARLINEA